MTGQRLIGSTIRRREDPRFITGTGTFVDDLQPEHTVHMAILRCPHAHARIRKLDLSAALSHAGVLDAAAGRDVAFLTATGEADDDQAHKDEGSSGEEEGGGDRPPLAVDVARYSGEGIAAVVAVDAYAAQDALDLIDVEWEPLPAYLQVGTTPAFKYRLRGTGHGYGRRFADRHCSQLFDG